MKNQLLRTLRNTDGFLSGQELCESMGVSRTAVWKEIHRLTEDGYEIEAITRRGYRLVSSPDVVTAEELGSRLKTTWAAGEVAFFESIDSTNNVIRQMAESGAPKGLLAVAEEQTGGRGRRGRSWNSPPGTGIWMSLLLRPSLAPEQVSPVTLAAALAVARAINRVTGLSAKIKWPNDIVVEGKKVTGILTEMVAEPDFVHCVILGIGINANQEVFPEDLPHAASLRMLLGHPIQRSELICAVWEEFEPIYEALERDGDLSSVRDAYDELLANRNTGVRVLAPAGEWEGVALGIDNGGALMVKKEDETVVCVSTGEVSVRGLYGYI